MFLQIFKSIIITIGVSLLFSLFFSYFNIPFLHTFIFFTLLQVLGFYFYGEFIRQRNARIQAEYDIEIARELSKSTAEVVCPCDESAKAMVPIYFDRKNTYKCQKCNKNVSIYVNLKTAIETIPVIDSPIDFITEEALEKLKLKNE